MSRKPAASGLVPQTVKRKVEQESYEAKRKREDAEDAKRKAERLKAFGTVALPRPKEGHTWLIYIIGDNDCLVSRYVGQVKTSVLAELEGYTCDSGEQWLRQLLEHQDQKFKVTVDDLVEEGRMDEYDMMIKNWFTEHGGAPQLCKFDLELGHDEQWLSVGCNDGPIRIMYGVSENSL